MDKPSINKYIMHLTEQFSCLQDGVHWGLVLEMEPQELGDQD